MTITDYSSELLDKVPLKPVRRGIVFAPNGGVNLMIKDKFQRDETGNQESGELARSEF